MFTNQGEKKSEEVESDEQDKNIWKNIFTSFFDFKNKKIFAGAIIVAVLAIIIIVFVVLILIKDDKPELSEEPVGSPTTPATLPGGLDSSAAVNANVQKYANVRAESLLYGNFYIKPKDDFTIDLADYNLPINIKSDVLNYYDVSRKASLDSVLDELNNNGFAAMDNPFALQADNFFEIYELLSSQSVPVLITNDFLIYYQQNIFKTIFKNIQKDVFYRNVWDIGKNLFAIADSRYRENFEKTGITNDHIVEGQRLEALYLAILLKLLQPTGGQIDPSDNYGNKDKFSLAEAALYNFNPPDYLQSDINREIELIKNARITTKSPTFLYKKDYTEYSVPNDYKKNAKLNNFYLAMRWVNSLFPAYYRNGDCENCLLDEDDWLISNIAACWLAKDFSDNQDIKNQWAKIYKIISFFSGLKIDLTYLQYQESLVNLFGDDYDINLIFSQDNKDKDENIARLSKALSKYKFSELEGGFSRDNEEDKPEIGMRMLQVPYWPNDYIFKQLTTPNVTLYNNTGERPNFGDNKTYCVVDRKYSRCKGIGLDIINLIKPLSKNNNYFFENTNYNNYEERVAKLKILLGGFNVNSWHNNNYWAVLDMGKSLIEVDDAAKPVFARNKNWLEKDINTVLGAWVNLQLPEDELDFGSSDNNVLPGRAADYNKYSYIEPNKNLIDELIANTNMLSGMLAVLGITNEVADLYTNLEELSNDLISVRKIIKKELGGEDLNEGDWQAIEKISTKFKVLAGGDKAIKMVFDTNKAGANGMNENIKGVKLLVIVYQYNSNKIIAVGPIFNYQEKE